MGWIEEERHRRSELEKSRQAEAREAADRQAREQEKQQKEAARHGDRLAREFAKRLKRVLPDGLTIVGQSYNAKEADWHFARFRPPPGPDTEHLSWISTGPVLRIDLGNGTMVDCFERSWTYQQLQISWRRGPDHKSRKQFMIFERSDDFSYDRPLAIIDYGKESLVAESIRRALYDAYQALAPSAGNPEAGA